MGAMVRFLMGTGLSVVVFSAMVLTFSGYWFAVAAHAGEGKLHLQLLFPGLKEGEFFVLTPGDDGCKMTEAIVTLVNRITKQDVPELPLANDDVIKTFEHGMEDVLAPSSLKLGPEMGAAYLIENNIDKIVLHRHTCSPQSLVHDEQGDIVSVPTQNMTVRSAAGLSGSCHSTVLYGRGFHHLYSRQKSPMQGGYQYDSVPPTPILFRPLEGSNRNDSWALIAGIAPAGRMCKGTLVKLQAVYSLGGMLCLTGAEQMKPVLELWEAHRVYFGDQDWRQHITEDWTLPGMQELKKLLQLFLYKSPSLAAVSPLLLPQSQSLFRPPIVLSQGISSQVTLSPLARSFPCVTSSLTPMVRLSAAAFTMHDESGPSVPGQIVKRRYAQIAGATQEKPSAPETGTNDSRRGQLLNKAAMPIQVHQLLEPPSSSKIKQASVGVPKAAHRGKRVVQ